jgi:hypothetical protein
MSDLRVFIEPWIKEYIEVHNIAKGLILEVYLPDGISNDKENVVCRRGVSGDVYDISCCKIGIEWFEIAPSKYYEFKFLVNTSEKQRFEFEFTRKPVLEQKTEFYKILNAIFKELFWKRSPEYKRQAAEKRKINTLWYARRHANNKNYRIVLKGFERDVRAVIAELRGESDVANFLENMIYEAMGREGPNEWVNFFNVLVKTRNLYQTIVTTLRSNKFFDEYDTGGHIRMMMEQVRNIMADPVIKPTASWAHIGKLVDIISQTIH